jgi:hypothetical protein
VFSKDLRWREDAHRTTRAHAYIHHIASYPDALNDACKTMPARRQTPIRTNDTD